MDTSGIERERKISEHVKEVYVAYAKALKSGLIEKGKLKPVLTFMKRNYFQLEDV